MPGGTRTAYAVPASQIGLALETTRGTPPAAPSYMIPVRGPKYTIKLDMIPDETLQGNMVQVYDDIPGLRYDSHGWDGYPYLDSLPLFIACELGSADTMTAAPASTTLAAAATAGSTTISTAGSIAANSYIVIGSGSTLETHYTTAVSGSASPYTVTLQTPLLYNQANGATVTGLTTHAFSLLNNAGGVNQPPSASIWDYDGEEWRLLSAAQMDEFTIKGTGTGLADYTVTWFANPAQMNATAPSVSYTTVPTPAPWTATLLFNGTQVNTVVDWEFDLKRGVKPIPALTGSQEYFMYFSDMLQATGKLTFVEQAGSPYLSTFQEGSSFSIDLTLYDLSTGDALNLHSSRAKYLTGDLNRGGQWVEAEMTFQLLPSSTDALAGGRSPIKITVANSVTTQYWK